MSVFFNYLHRKNGMLKSIALIMILFYSLPLLSQSFHPITIYLDCNSSPYSYGMQETKVALSNATSDSVLIITGLQFIGQLPNTDYYYHGIYGNFKKDNGVYQHNQMTQQLSRPVASKVLLPAQTIVWNYRLRLGKPIRAIIKWKCVSALKAHEMVYYNDGSVKSHFYSIYVPLCKKNELKYRALSGIRGATPLCIVEKIDSLKEYTDTISVNLIKERKDHFHNDSTKVNALLRDIHANQNSIVTKYVLSHNPAVYLNDSQAVFVEYNTQLKKYEKWITLQPTVVDFISSCLNFNTTATSHAVPAIIDDSLFSDIVKVNKPKRNMYYDPGITNLNEAALKKCLIRAKDRKLKINIEVCDPNSLGAMLILKMGK